MELFTPPPSWVEKKQYNLRILPNRTYYQQQRLLIHYFKSKGQELPLYVRRCLLSGLFENPLDFNIVRPPFREDEFRFFELAIDRGMTEHEIEQESLHQDWILDCAVHDLHTQFWWLMSEMADDLTTFSTYGISYIHHIVESDTYPHHQYPELRALFHDMVRFMMVRIQPWLNPEGNHRVLEQAILCHDPILVRILVESGCRVTPSILHVAEGNLPEYVPMCWWQYTEQNFMHPGVIEYLRSVPSHEEDWNGEEYTAHPNCSDCSDTLGNGLRWPYIENVQVILKEVSTLGHVVTPFLTEPLNQIIN